MILPMNELRNSLRDDLEYLVGKYLAATVSGKPSPRVASQIRHILDANEVYLEAKNELDRFKIEFEANDSIR